MKKIKEAMFKGYVKVITKFDKLLADERGDVHQTNILIMILIAIMAGGLIFVFMKAQTPQVLQKLLDKFTTIFNL